MTRPHYAPILASIAVMLVLAAPGQALHCNGSITTIDAGAQTLYLDHRSDGAGEIDHWLYLEDNGIDGLQSGSPVPPVTPPGCYDVIHYCMDPCDHPNPDLWII